MPKKQPKFTADLPLTLGQQQVITWNLELAGLTSEMLTDVLAKAGKRERQATRKNEALTLARLLLYYHKMGRISPNNTIENFNKLLSSQSLAHMMNKGVRYPTNDEPTELMYKIRDYWKKITDAEEKSSSK